MALEQRNEAETPTTVVGYFRSGDDAHRAIDELVKEGFHPENIGAAFHTDEHRSEYANEYRGGEKTGEFGRGQNEQGGRDIGEMNIRTNVSPGTIGSGSGITGAASDTSAVTPSGVTTGSGTMPAGAGRPMPSEGVGKTGLPSELSHESPKTATGSFPGTGGFSDSDRKDRDESEARARTGTQSGGGSAGKSSGWGDKLSHVFGNNKSDSGENLVNKTSMNFGTGQGHIGAITPENEYEYSGPALESSFTGMGVDRERSRHISGQFVSGGAVVTVNSAGRVSEVERIFERNGGSVRTEPTSAAGRTEENASQRHRVQVFGSMQKSYPSYLGTSGSTRKAS